MDIQFLEYIPTPGDKHLGIASIIYKDIILRFRINPGKEGHGFYATPSAHKVGDRYLDSFEIDSRREHARMLEIVKEGVKNAGKPKADTPMSGSVFDSDVPF